MRLSESKRERALILPSVSIFANLLAKIRYFCQTAMDMAEDLRFITILLLDYFLGHPAASIAGFLQVLGPVLVLIGLLLSGRVLCKLVTRVVLHLVGVEGLDALCLAKCDAEHLLGYIELLVDERSLLFGGVHRVDEGNGHLLHGHHAAVGH